ncbi:MAG: Type cbb3 cytochrome oxidase biosis protein CcoI [Labilithrix sp.]|nr:Type cbb3 cytochrome oxidase biosis protein CcoI [Labilithrix sp.]
MSRHSRAAALVPASCLHCGASLVASDLDGFCCRGCAEVHRLVREAGLERFYDLGGGEGHPVVSSFADHKWLEPIAQRLEDGAEITALTLDVQGVHCAACVWLIEKLFSRLPGAHRVIVNPAVGSVDIVVAREFPLARFVEAVEAFGYRFGPPLKAARQAPSDLVWRMGVCIAIAMNTMIFGFATYCGLSSGPVYHLFHALDFGLSFVSVLVGGTVFFRSAWQALRRRVLHLDLPIALGVALVFASSTYTYLNRGGASSYFDTLNVFIALMLVGRFLQERVLAKNRAMLLASDGAEGLYTRRIGSDGSVALVRCTELASGDVVLAGRGDVVPVESVLLEEEPALFSLDWISGESAPRAFEPGSVVPAGAFSQGGRAVRLRTLTPFDGSTLVSLLRTSTRRDRDASRSTDWHRRLTGYYVSSVLALAVLAFSGWIVATSDLPRTLDVVAAVLIVTCPCAFGIATPLAYELAQGSLRRAGLFVRTPGFLDRAAEVTRVAFDKTGTLTTGKLVLDNPEVQGGLAPADRVRLFAMAVRSSHPKSRAIVSALEVDGGAPSFEKHDVQELTGKGLELMADGHLFRLGASAWAVAPAKVPALEQVRSPNVLFTRDGEVLASFAIGEELRSDAADEVRELQREGYETFIVSGDDPAATRAMARACGIPEEQADGGRSPEDKAAWVRSRNDAKTLFVGDGINDSLVAEEAYCAGTPAIDRPFMASRCDFYFVTPGLRPIREALATSRRLACVVRRNLCVALIYNAVTVGLALAGLMTPLLCAVLMPISSLSTVLATTTQLSLRGPRRASVRREASERRSPSWRS